MFDEECEVILEPGSQQQCTMVDQVKYSDDNNEDGGYDDHNDDHYVELCRWSMMSSAVLSTARSVSLSRRRSAESRR